MSEVIDKIIKTKKFPPVLLMFGDEEFLLEEALDSLLINFNIDSTSFNLDIINAEESSIDTVINLASSYAFMSDYRVIIVKNFDKLFAARASKKKEQSNPFERYLASPQPTTFLILIASLDSLNGITNELRSPKNKAKAEKKIEGLKTPFKTLLEKHEWIEFPKVYESEYFNWISKRFIQLKKKIDPEAIELLIAHSSQSLREISNEIEKLITFSQGKDEISIKDVNFIVGSSRSFNVFELQKAIGERSIKDSISIILNMLINEHQEMLIITMLTRYFTILWKLSEEKNKSSNNFALAGIVGVSPYFIPEYLRALEKYKPKDLENAFFALHDADLALKTSQGHYLYIMEKMILSIIDGKN